MYTRGVGKVLVGGIDSLMRKREEEEEEEENKGVFN